VKQVVPYIESSASKKEQVGSMFDDISPKYDLLNRVLSMGIDTIWRTRVVNILSKGKPEKILDVATGTADLAIALRKTGAKQIIGADISEGMLRVGREKIKEKGLDSLISLEYGDSENLKYDSDTFDAVTVAFGARNFENLQKGLSEMRRVLKPGGTIAVLEFSQPQKFPFRQLYHFYFHNVLPVVGRLVSKNSSAYTYLPESVSVFPYGQKFVQILQETGFKNCTCIGLTFGIASIYIGNK
jgi:demethylmenaquinone methyltransferase/2-methoxy-6-polyprenyl-1,4-benzoquinol methylase